MVFAVTTSRPASPSSFNGTCWRCSRRVSSPAISSAGSASIVSWRRASLCYVALPSPSGLTGVDIHHFWVALLFLGLGWNFLYVAGTSQLTKCYRPSERAKIQAFNDCMIFSGVALCSYHRRHGRAGLWLGLGPARRHGAGGPASPWRCCSAIGGNASDDLNRSSWSAKACPSTLLLRWCARKLVGGRPSPTMTK